MDRAKLEEYVEVRALIDSTKEQLKSLEARRRDHEREIMDAMINDGVSSFKTSSGLTVSAYEFETYRLPSDPRRLKRVLTWIRKCGGGELIQEQVSVAVNDFPAFCKEMREKGHDPPEEAGRFAEWRLSLTGRTKRKSKAGEPPPADEEGEPY